MAEVTRERCLKAKAIALSDKKVMDTIITNIETGWDLTRISCLKEGTSPEQVVVLVETDMPDGAFMPGSFVATVSLTEGKVLEIEPYVPEA